MGRHSNQKTKTKDKRKQQKAKQIEPKKSDSDVMEKAESHARGLTLKEYLRVGKQIEICSLTVTCFVVGVLLEFGVLSFLSVKWSAILATIFILFSYLLLLVIAKELKKRDIHGIRDSAWAAFILFLIQKGIDDSPKWLFTCFFIGEILCIYSIINGLIRLSISIAYYIKTASNAEGKIISSVETIIVAFTAIISIVISLLK